MLDNLKQKLVEEIKDISKDGIKSGNIEYISKLAETYKNINKAEKEEIEAMIYDERLEGNYSRDRRYGNDRYGDDRYMDGREERYSARGRGSNARRDSRGRYADSGYMIPFEERYYDYMDNKQRYRDSGTRKEEMHEGLEMVMKYMTNLVEDLYRDLDSEEERRIMDKYIRKLSEIH